MVNNSPRHPLSTAEYNDMVATDMLERVLQERVRQLLQLHGWRHYHTHLAKHSPAGFPDVCAIRGNRLLFAELKREKGKTTPAQDAWLADLRALPGIEVYVWRPLQLLNGEIADVLR